nr:ABC transporter permease [Brucepastera parasyntrophica]
MKKTGPGYRYRISGQAPEFARFTGLPVGRVTVAGMTLSGLFHGLTGFFAVTGTWYTCHQGFSAGMGWAALAIALIAKKNLLAVIPAAFLYTWFETASETAMLSTQFSFDAASLIQAFIFLFITMQIVPFLRSRQALRPEKKT